MSRYGYRGTAEETLVQDGDAAFLGMDAKSSPSALEPGMAAWLENKRILHGAAVTRRGCAEPGQWNSVPFGRIYGHGRFENPLTGEKYLLVAVVDGVLALHDGAYPFKISLPVNVELSGPVTFTQCFDSVLLFRSGGLAPLSWSGSKLSSFKAIADPVAPAVAIPSGEQGVLVADRLLIPYDRDKVAVSDILNFAQYDAALFDYTVNQGDGDVLVAIQSWQNQTVVLFKQNSIHGFAGFSGDLSGSSIQPINSRRGCWARKSVASVGGDLFFLSEGGVYRLLQVIQDRLQVAEMPVSDALDPVRRRVNWDAADGAAGGVLGKYYYLAVPLDGSAYNNAVLVLNTVTGQWESVDFYGNANGVGSNAGLQILGFERVYWSGRPVLAMICNRSSGNGCVLLHEFGQYDVVGGVKYHVIDQVRTRFYSIGSKDFKGFNRAKLGLKTINPFVSVSALRPGVRERKLLDLALTKDRSKYYVHGLADFDPADLAADANKPLRQDYSVKPGSSGQWVGAGLELEREQESTEIYELREQAEGMALEITGSQGSVAVGCVTCEGFEAQRDSKTKV